MTGRGKKTQSTSQRSTKNRSSRGGGAGQNITSSKNRNASKNIRAASSTSSTNRGQTEDKDLKRQISEWQSKYEALKKLSDQNDILQNEDDEAESDDNRSAKRRKKSSDDEEKIKKLLKLLIKGYPSELNLKYEDTFKSDANVKICQKLIPALKKDIKLWYDLTDEQVESWLQSFHRNKRHTYLKSNDAPENLNSQVEAAKRQTKSKGKKSVDSSEDEEGRAKNLLKVLIKGYPSELNLKYQDTFKSDANVKICQKLIPMLQKDVKSWYNLSHDQVENWLQTFHRNKRKTFLKSDNMMID